MKPILFASAALLALSACGRDADENPRDLNVIDNHVGAGNVLEPPTGAGPTITPTDNGFIVEPAGNAAATGNAAAPAGNAAAPAGNRQ